MKKKCFAALSGLFLAISIIAPFSFSTVKADEDYFFTYIPSVDINDGDATYVYIDFVFSSKYLCSGTFSFNYIVSGQVGNWGMIDGEGVTNVTMTTVSPVRTITVDFGKTHFFVFRLKVSALDSWWSAADLKNPAQKLGITANMDFISVDTSITTGSTEQNVSLIRTYLWRIIQQGITVDLSNIDFSELTDNQQTMIDLLTEIRDGSTEASTSVDNNDTQNSSGAEVISEYDTLTSTFESDFTDSQTEMTEILDNTSLTQFAAAAVWFTYQLGYLYNSLGDMKILVALPLILGIALFFIGRGNVIFRDPNTQIWNETYIHDTYADGSESFSKRSTISYNKKNKTKVKPKYF